MIKYSVIIPVYNSEKVIELTVSKVRDFFLKEGLDHEIILIDDGSPDNSWKVISRLASTIEEVKAIALIKNYGQHSANMCGFREATGDFVITMDDDLQNPPEEIGKLIDATGGDYDLVIGRFQQKKHAFHRRLGSLLVGWINRQVFEVEDGLVLSNFRIIRRDVIDRVIRQNDFRPYIPGLILKYSTKRKNVLVKHSARMEGSSNYTVRKLVSLVATILFNHSTLPLRYGAGFGFIVAGVSFILGMYYLLAAFINGTDAPGWPTLVVLLSFFNGILIMLLSIIGEYIVRILQEQSNDSSYFVREIVS
jgi:glycosyltransferase involved in cell wall biosynthesis